MLFNSLTFLVFLGLFLCFWPLFRKVSSSRWAYLSLTSFVFYSWWDYRYLSLLLLSGLIDFYAALGIERKPRQKKLYLLLSLVSNLGLLFSFKYFNFFVDISNSLGGFLGLRGIDHASDLILPVGISFYTFQSLSYTIDVYRGEITPTKSITHFFAYLALFPQLVAGPIVRAKDLLPQLTTFSAVTRGLRWEGTILVASGFFKKVVIADNLSPIVESYFGAVGQHSAGAAWWLATLLFGFQIYYDFSGYSDIARGIAKWMGYDFPLNFNFPYFAVGLQDFWRRWHISLSTWFRDYVYLPLGGSRGSSFAAVKNIFITLMISGLWHGANYTFVLWGIFHFLFLATERFLGLGTILSKTHILRFVFGIFTFIQVTFCWVFFRAQSVADARAIVSHMLSFDSFLHYNSDHALLLLLPVISEIMFYCMSKQIFKKFKIVEVLYVSLLIVACVFFRGPGNAFIYFQF